MDDQVQQEADVSLQDAATAFIDLELRRRKVASELKQIEEQQSGHKQALLTIFQKTGMNSFHARGLTVYLARQTWAGLKAGVDKTAGCLALKAAGLGDLVAEGYNSNSVSARLREFGEDDNGEPTLPPELDKAWTMNEVFDVRTRLG